MEKKLQPRAVAVRVIYGKKEKERQIDETTLQKRKGTRVGKIIDIVKKKEGSGAVDCGN